MSCNNVVVIPKVNCVRAMVGVKMPVYVPQLDDYATKEFVYEKMENKLDATKLDEAIYGALAEAKASGEFKGEKGEKGEKGLQGEKGADGRDGRDGANGVNGRDGKDGKDGAKGEDGRTPIKGEDYFTEEDKVEFVKDITPTIKDKVEEIIGDVDLDGNASSIVYDSSMATTHEVANVKDALDKLLNKVYYVALSLSSSSGGGTYEKGSTQEITIETIFNKVPDSITIVKKINTTTESETITPSETITKTYNNVTSNTTYTLTAYSKNAEGQTINVPKTFYATFVNKKYYGVSSKTTLTSAEINSLTGVLDADRKGDFTVNAGSGQYIFFAIPSAYGTPAFKVGGFDGGFDKVETISHTNKSGHIENYDVYKSTNASLGNTTVTVN